VKEWTDPLGIYQLDAVAVGFEPIATYASASATMLINFDPVSSADDCVLVVYVTVLTDEDSGITGTAFPDCLPTSLASIIHAVAIVFSYAS